MKFKFIGNACGVFEGSRKTKILCDPWIKNGVFEGSWYHYPPLKTKINQLQNIDAIYISHIHPDHFDVRNFFFNKKIPIIILDEEPNFLKKILQAKGFKNLILIRDGQTVQYKEFKLSMFKPFAGHIFEESLIGNLIDSAIVLQNKSYTAINFNDNTPTLNACKFLKKKYKNIDLAMLNYNAAGPYPSCFENLNYNEKIKEHEKLLIRNFNYLCKVIPILKPKNILPFAGSYILGGKLYKKNDYLGTTTWDNCADFLRKKIDKKFNVICLRENNIFDISNSKIDHPYKRINVKHMKKYIQKIKKHKYEYEKDSMPSLPLLKKKIIEASRNLNNKIKNFNVNIKSNVYIKLGKNKIKILNGKIRDRKIICSMDPRLLKRILDRKAHWNNAEIGCHINFYRTPNKMDADVHTAMSFFHI